MKRDYSGIILAAPNSGSGKTTITLGLLRLLLQAGQRPQAYKVGPDYIDTHYHSLASKSECHNLDPWAMRPLLIAQIISHLGASKFNLVEGMMGLFDGVTPESGSTADLAKLTGWPVILIIDASKQSHSIGALVKGFLSYRKDIEIAGVILNKVGSTKHTEMLKQALKPLNITVFGAIPRNPDLERPSRHLGLHQAHEHKQIDGFIDKTAEHLKQHLNLSLIQTYAQACSLPQHIVGDELKTVAPLGKHIAIAKDDAFSFVYAHFVSSWNNNGSEISYFSPLADEKPDLDCDTIFLPGGYPELHLPELESAQNFKQSLIDAAQQNKTIYAECGGHMVLGQSITGKDQKEYSMTGLLPHKTSFAKPKMTLGYRQLELVQDNLLGPTGTIYSGHEFHYSQEIAEPDDRPLFKMANATGASLPNTGYHRGNVCSSFVHLIDIAKTTTYN